MLLMKGKEVADAAKAKIITALAHLKQDHITITLAILIVGNDQASHAYKDRMVKLAASLNIQTRVVLLPATANMPTVLSEIQKLNIDESITGILPMMPLPKHLDTNLVANEIAVNKDVDCLNTYNIGELYSVNSRWAPCTPRAVMTTLAHYNILLAGKHVVIIGRSNVVGKPVANLLLAANATVTICHSKTINLPEITRQADIIVAAVGVPGFVTAEMVKDDVIVVDVGINSIDGKLVGDVQPDVQAKAAAFTPVPGGIGTVTTTMLVQALLRNYYYYISE